MSSGYNVYLDLQKASYCQIEQPSFGHVSSVFSCVRQNSDFKDLLNDHSPFWNWNTHGHDNVTGVHEQKRAPVSFVSSFFIILMLIPLACLIFYKLQRFRYVQGSKKLERKLYIQTKRALGIIPTSVLKADDIEANEIVDTCAVCIENCKYT